MKLPARTRLGREGGNSHHHFTGIRIADSQGVLQRRGHELPEAGQAIGVPRPELVDLPPVAVLQRGQHLLLGDRGFGKLSTEENQELRGTPQPKALLAELAGVALPQQPAAEPGIDGLPAFPVVVVIGHGLHGLRLMPGAQQAIDALNGGKFHPGSLPGPVPRGRDHQQWPGSHQGPNLHVVGVEPEVGLVLADAAALHVVGNHVDRRRHLDPIVDRGQKKGLGPPARSPGAADPIGVHVRQGLKEIHRANAVPELNPQPVDAPQAEAPVQRTAVILDLAAVVVGQHVVGKDYVALPGQVDPKARHRSEGLIFQPPVSPMTVGSQDSREGPLLPHRTVEIPGDVKPRIALKEDLLDGVVPLGNLPENPRLERTLLHRWPQPGADLYLPPQIPGPFQPGLFGQKRLESIRQVQVSYPGGSLVHLRQTGHRLGPRRPARQQEANARQQDLFDGDHGFLTFVGPSAQVRKILSQERNFCDA